MGGRAVVAWVVLATLGCVACTACGADERPLRAQTPARRHVLLGLGGAWPADKLMDGSLVDRSNEHFDLERCTRLCAAALGPGDRVAGCFYDAGMPPDMRARLPVAAHDAILDCAIQ